MHMHIHIDIEIDVLFHLQPSVVQASSLLAWTLARCLAGKLRAVNP